MQMMHQRKKPVSVCLTDLALSHTLLSVSLITMIQDSIFFLKKRNPCTQHCQMLGYAPETTKNIVLSYHYHNEKHSFGFFLKICILTDDFLTESCLVDSPEWIQDHKTTQKCCPECPYKNM